MLEADGSLLLEAVDLTRLRACEYSVRRRVDVLLGRASATSPCGPVDPLAAARDPFDEQTEHRVLALIADGAGPTGRPLRVLDLHGPAHAGQPGGPSDRSSDSPGSGSSTNPDVVRGAELRSGRWSARADLLLPEPADPTTFAVVQVRGTARRADATTALLQGALFAGLADELADAGTAPWWAGGRRPGPRLHLVEPTSAVRVHDRAVFTALVRHQQQRLIAVVDDQRASAPVSWTDADVPRCLWCNDCRRAETEHRDVQLVAGMRSTVRTALLTAGHRTVDELAASDGPVPDVPPATLDPLRAQARLQLTAGIPPRPDAPLRYEIADPTALDALPGADRGDLFFDFESDPMYVEDGWPDQGLDYLFGLLGHDLPVPADHDGSDDSDDNSDDDRDGGAAHLALWSRDRAEERAALQSFLDLVDERRRRWPGLHIYHYASYETDTLRRLTRRHRLGEDRLAALLRDGVFVDLYRTVRRALRISESSYSLKRLEPLHLGPATRSGPVTTAAGSVLRFHQQRAARAAGDAAAADGMLAELGTYNADDCRSTRALRDWLLARRGAQPDPAPRELPGDRTEPRPVDPEPDRAVAALDRFAGTGPPLRRSADQEAALVLADLARPRSPRALRGAPATAWVAGPDPAPGAGTLLDAALVGVDADWARPAGGGPVRRLLRWRLPGRSGTDTPDATGTSSDGSNDGSNDGGPDTGTTGRHPGPVVHCLYDPPRPVPGGTPAPLGRVLDGGDGDALVLVVAETLPSGVDPYEDLPDRLAVGRAPRSPAMTAVRALATTVADALPDLPASAATALLRRAGSVAPGLDPERVLDRLTGSDRSFLAVPTRPSLPNLPTVASLVAVLRAAVERSWRVGVSWDGPRRRELADGLAEAGLAVTLNPAQVPVAGLTAGLVVADSRCLTDPGRAPGECFDLLVVVDADRLPLGDAVAAARTTRRLLLLGDPSRALAGPAPARPHPADRSVMSWVLRPHPPTDVHALLAPPGPPPRAVVAAPLARPPGLTVVARSVRHDGCGAVSEPEAAAVVAEVAALLDPAGPAPVPDVLVATPFHQQATLLRRRLADAGRSGVEVVTTDRLTDRQAGTVVLSLAASRFSMTPRGAAVLCSPGRWSSALDAARRSLVVVHGSLLFDECPDDPRTAAEVGAVLHLLGPDLPDSAG
ncbi:TM0106 family RecB-like putative nuclease [Nakamurella leprariae]|uniref:TM0106 family RecB-like putative nuclease n=1 Tax=Nakamurella leprariae TaxID=2803911 RepID=A0A938YDX4_9ACTN|nr:TM0106 family RecB-like putative nuclease [Nakamurella leprariae]MBM9468049.1 TM0106 family RecB-like putative nuclease [Nakamurella leprariae]